MNRLTTNAIISLLDKDQQDDLIHHLLHETKPVLWTVLRVDSLNGYVRPEGCYMLMSEAIDYIISKIEEIIDLRNEEYNNFFYYDSNTDNNILLSSREEMVKKIIDSGNEWTDGTVTYTIMLNRVQ